MSKDIQGHFVGMRGLEYEWSSTNSLVRGECRFLIQNPTHEQMQALMENLYDVVPVTLHLPEEQS